MSNPSFFLQLQYMANEGRRSMLTWGFWPSLFQHLSYLLATIHLQLCDLCMNLLPPAGSAHETSLIAWLCSESTTRWLYLRIHKSSPPPSTEVLEKSSGTPAENMAQDSEARCRIDLCKYLNGFCPLEPQVQIPINNPKTIILGESLFGRCWFGLVWFLCLMAYQPL